ncbi:CGNR zinc finger domain-containing protein [Pseudonocardia nematodicida]|uniref:CGNR zinc finger domain-containing protein n=1 Tax=Pseudonocardia nematodicida TaxID=1206997 RepID=A0ABV1K7H1_9PSEU
MVDPRPLTGEPLPLDLLNTRWISHGDEHDLLASPDGVATWLAAHGLGEHDGERTGAALRQARTVMADLLREPTAAHGVAFDELLARGRLRRGYDPDGDAVTRPETDDPAWLPAWTAAEALLRLLETTPGRIRRCDHDACVLHFLDTSRNGTRRWCSMASCGNRAKSNRHYARTREA